MSKKRTLPFGYCMRNGCIDTEPTEVYWVTRIFAEYLAGNSLSQIASLMDDEQIPYTADSTKWNKSMIKRIIENDKYLGSENFPKLISEETYAAANEIRLKKATSLSIVPDEIADIRSMSYCAECKCRLSRTGGNTKYIYWDCKNPDCYPYEFAITDQMIISAVLNIINSAIVNLSLIESGGNISTYNPNGEITRQQNEINHMLDGTDVDYDRAKAEIIRLAEMKYNCCTYDDTQQKTEMLRTILKDRNQLETLDTGLMKVIAKRILISHYCTIELELINGVVIKNTTERKENDE